MDTPGAYETKATEAMFNVTLPEPDWKPEKVEQWMQGFNRGTIISTAIHEVYPGHYTQFLWLQAAPSKTRKLLYNNSNAEGWAHYTEQMMLDEGYGNHDPKLRLGQLLDALLRDARFIVGIEMHTGKMTLDQATGIFREGRFPGPARGGGGSQARHFRSHYLYYTLGKLQILKLREDYRKHAGRQIHPAGISRPLHAAGFGAHEDHSQEHAGERQSDSCNCSSGHPGSELESGSTHAGSMLASEAQRKSVMTMRVRKAVFPAAGLGTRFLPATKAQPKEMLPLVDKPIIQYGVEEAVAAGCDQIIIVTGRGKQAIEDHFDVSYELEKMLEERGKTDLLQIVRQISDLIHIAYVRQKEALGLGHAVLTARELVGNEPFAVLLADDVIDADVPCLKQMMNVFEKTQCSVLATQVVEGPGISAYGVLDGQAGAGIQRQAV